MKQLLTRYDIMQLLSLSRWKFYDVTSSLGIVPIDKFGKMSCYNIQDMIDIYNYLYVKREVAVYKTFESKINYKEVPL